MVPGETSAEEHNIICTVGFSYIMQGKRAWDNYIN